MAVLTTYIDTHGQPPTAEQLMGSKLVLRQLQAQLFPASAEGGSGDTSNPPAPAETYDTYTDEYYDTY